MVFAPIFLLEASKFTIESKDGMKISAKDIRFKENNIISFKRVDNQKTYSISSDRLSKESLENLKSYLRSSIRYKFEVISLGSKRDSEKTWKTDYGSKTVETDVTRSFQVEISTHSYLPAEVELKIYSIQGKETKAAYLLKSLDQLVDRLNPLIEEVSDTASLEFTKYAAAGFDQAKGNDEIDFYIAVSNPDTGQAEEWASSSYVLNGVKSGKIKILDKDKALDVADQLEVKLHKSDKYIY